MIASPRPRHREFLTPWPIERPRNWLKIVNTALTKKELAQVCLSATRGRPYGDPAWIQHTAAALDLDHTLRHEGRPPKGVADGVMT